MKRSVSKIAVVLLSCIALCGVASANTLKIGAILSVSGPTAFLGVPEANTLEMLVESINARGGINGEMIELIIKDSAGQKEKAVSYAKQLIEEEKVFAILGPTRTGSTMAIKGLCEKSETLLISCASSKMIVDPVARFVYKSPQNDSLAVRKILEHMQKNNISKIGVAAGGTGFGKLGKMFTEELAPEYGITVISSEVYAPNVTDLSSLVAKWKGTGEIEAVINWSIVPAQTILAKNMRQANWDVPLYLSHGFGNIKYVEVGGKAMEGVIFPAGRLLIAETLDDSNPQKKVLVEYKQDYEAKFSEPVSTFGGHAYDAMMILVQALEEVGVADKMKVRENIENMSFVGTGGIFQFTPEDHSGLDINAFEMMTVKDGKFVQYREN
ncbi:ABC transporter substrate-binding protein [Desulfopila inferna]|uniref:ABC transporter substrate-binding protein n=1 Tax=Desulfopila inferna TaxID=468528 RepID=UPI001962D711|nr:ABC transporter substrate-binding protein [Desulfopila inferna]MBM9604734.1 ABC transporter substrate-binding protein [Desulfopila inferna]